jgi:hypothetical protein
MELFGKFLVIPRYYKWDVVKTRQASHGLIETHQKRSLENNVISKRGREKYTHFEIGGHVQIKKEWSRGTKEVLVIGLHMVGKMSLDLLNHETLKFLTHFRENGSSLYFIFISYILIFFLFSFFLYNLTFFFFIFSFFSFFICSPWTLKLHCTYMRLHYLDELRHVYFTRISVHIGFVTSIKQQQLPQLVTGHVKWLFL